MLQVLSTLSSSSFFLMELDFFFFFFVSIFVAFLLFVLKFNTGRNTRLPPGPSKLPIIGNLHQLIGSLPHHRLRDLAKKHGPLMHLQLGENSTVVVSSAEFAKQVMKTHDVVFASRPRILAMEILFYNSTSIVFSPYGDYWRQVKKISTIELLTPKRVQSFRSIREEEVSSLVNWIALKEGSPINFTRKVYTVNSCIILRTAFGTKSELDHHVIRSIMQETLDMLSGFNIVDLFPSIGMLQWITGIRSRLNKLHEETDRILENIINKHKQAAGGKISEENNKDLVDVLLKVQEDGDDGFHLTTDNIKAVILDMFVAGADTPSTIVNWAMVELMKNPRLMKKTQAEVREVFNKFGKVDDSGISQMKFLKAVVKETLRLHPPGAFLGPRECRERCEINGFEIPVKTKVVVNAWAIGRDPEYWREPESFVPERFLESPIDYKGNNFEYIPFGAGRRICPGISFGMANIELALAMLLFHFDWKLPDGMKHEDLDMTEKFGISIRRKDDLNVIPILYHPGV